MAVYFVYRSADVEFSCLHRKRFAEATVLDWVRKRWKPIADDGRASAYADKLLGVRVYSFYDVFRAVAELGTPTTIEDLRGVMSWCYHGKTYSEEHCVQVLTDDDSIELAYYFFDDHFAQEHPELTAYLLCEGPLPDGAGEPGWRSKNEEIEQLEAQYCKEGEGRLYASLQRPADSEWFSDQSAQDVDVVEGLRLPELCRELMCLPADQVEGELRYFFLQIREILFADDLVQEEQERAFVQALQAEPSDEATWRAYTDWLMERGEPCPGVRLLGWALQRLRSDDSGSKPNVVQVGEHVAEACLFSEGDFEQLFLFDDLWGSAHPVLAESLLRYLSRWDILSTGNETRSE